jgi:short-subunit dehydrogenase
MLDFLLQPMGCVVLAALGLGAARCARSYGAVAGRRARCAGQVAIVTGGSSGIGLAIAHRLAARGMKLVLAARGAEQLAAAAEELRASGADVQVVPTDISDPGACDALVRKTLDAFGRLDLVVACAGIGHHGLASEDDLALQRKLIEVNHFGTINTVRAVVPSLLEYGGELFVMGSISGVVGSPLRTAYCASKYATMGYVESLRLELAMLGTPLPITVCMPGSVDTPFRKHNIGPRPKMSADECADLAVAGWERGDYKVYCPTHASLMIWVPPVFGQWTMDLFMKKSASMLHRTPCAPPLYARIIRFALASDTLRACFGRGVDQAKLFNAFTQAKAH